MNSDERACPDCAEPIKRQAVVCKRCGYRFRQTEPKWILYAILGGVFFIAIVSGDDTPTPAPRPQSAVAPTLPPNLPRRRPQPSTKTGVQSSTETMSFERCIAWIQEVAGEFGIAPINIIESNIVRTVRFNTSDSSLLVTCSRPDRTMVLTRSPHRG